MSNEHILTVRPGNPRGGKLLKQGDLYRTNRCMHLILEPGIQVQIFTPRTRTIILENNEFCVVVHTGHTNSNVPPKLAVCLPNKTNGREVLFTSPTYTPDQPDIEKAITPTITAEDFHKNYGKIHYKATDGNFYPLKTVYPICLPVQDQPELFYLDTGGPMSHYNDFFVAKLVGVELHRKLDIGDSYRRISSEVRLRTQNQEGRQL